MSTEVYYSPWQDVPCKGLGKLFDGIAGPEGVYFPHEDEAKALCTGCPLRGECAVRYFDCEDMIVAGKTPAERGFVPRPL